MDRARFVTASGLALAATSSGDSLRGPSAMEREVPDASEPAHGEVIEVAPGAEVRITRTFGPMDPFRGCAPDPALGSVVFVDDGLDFNGEAVEARFKFQRK